MDLPERIYSERDVENARTKGQMVGWFQGGAVVVAGLFLLNFVGWIPGLLVVGVVGYFIYKWLTKTKSGKGGGAGGGHYEEG